jgi:hypothetical protein
VSSEETAAVQMLAEAHDPVEAACPSGKRRGVDLVHVLPLRRPATGTAYQAGFPRAANSR